VTKSIGERPSSVLRFRKFPPTNTLAGHESKARNQFICPSRDFSSKWTGFVHSGMMHERRQLGRRQRLICEIANESRRISFHGACDADSSFFSILPPSSGPEMTRRAPKVETDSVTWPTIEVNAHGPWRACSSSQIVSNEIMNQVFSRTVFRQGIRI
jgi:hypothetical protein